jgi:hypothetical protein
MKALILALALFSSVASFASEGHEGPEAAPRLKAPVIAKVVTGSGFAPPTVARSTIVQIRSNGEIERIRNFANGDVQQTDIAALAPALAQQILETSRKVKQTVVRDPQPANPGCEDAPSTVYYAVQAGKDIVIAARENCKDMEKVDESDADRDLKRALSGAAELANVAP